MKDKLSKKEIFEKNWKIHRKTLDTILDTLENENPGTKLEAAFYGSVFIINTIYMNQENITQYGLNSDIAKRLIRYSQILTKREKDLSCYRPEYDEMQSMVSLYKNKKAA